MINKGELFLIPNTIGNDIIDDNIPNNIKYIIEKLDCFIVENQKAARKFIKLVSPNKNQEKLVFFTLNKHTSLFDADTFLKKCLEGESTGLISDAGCPSIADPGSNIVAKAHQLKIKIRPLVGPSSIILSLMASGMNGQNFAFNGYLPIDKAQKIKKIKIFEKKAIKENQSQIFIETPYRNDTLAKDLIKTLSSTTKLCLATDLSLKTEEIVSDSVGNWRNKNLININKRPTIFIIDKG